MDTKEKAELAVKFSSDPEKIELGQAYLTQCQEVERLKDGYERLELALQYYADESEWSGSPWKLLFNSTYQDGHGYETAKTVLNRVRRAEDKQ